VLVESTNHFVSEAQKIGLLSGRIDRPFECYWPDKYNEHEIYPSIEVAHCSKLETSFEFIKTRILALNEAEDFNAYEGKDLPFLIMGPESGYHLKQLSEYLKENLDSSLFKIETAEEKEGLKLEDGYRVLHRGINYNLGWRIVMHFDPPKDLQKILFETRESNTPLQDLLPKEYIERHSEEVRKIFESEEDLESNEESTPSENELEKICIKLTNFYGAKGLSALHTFIVGLNNSNFPANPDCITDDEICKFIVALTRAKRSCSLVTNKEFDRKVKWLVSRPSKFIDMLPKESLVHKNFKIQKGELVQCE
jgi:superfamily I DNA/RNA helicase